MLWNEKSLPWRVPAYWILTIGSGAGTFYGCLLLELPEFWTAVISYSMAVGVMILCLVHRRHHPSWLERYPEFWNNAAILTLGACWIISSITGARTPGEFLDVLMTIAGIALILAIIGAFAMLPVLLFGGCMWIGSKFGLCHWSGWHWREF